MTRALRPGTATAIAALLAISLLAACDEPAGPTLPLLPFPLPADLSAAERRGAHAFFESCAPCHASGDGFDLARFGFADTTIIRRALDHVTRPTAEDIADYVAALGVDHVPGDDPPFQPSGETPTTDADWAVGLFGEDRWPVDMTADDLLALAPRDLPVPLPFLPWSDERSPLDWIPDRPLPGDLMRARDGALPRALRAYYAAPSMAGLLGILALFGELADGPEDSGRVCAGDVAGHVSPDACFQARRWMASLAAQHLLREGPVHDVPVPIVDLWWDVGEASVSQGFRRLGSGFSSEVAYRSAAAWLYLAWSFEPVRAEDNPLYFAEQLVHAGYRRMAAYVSLYSMVLDPEGEDGGRPYTFHLQAFGRAPDHWTYDTNRWGYRYLESLLDRGIVPTAAGRETALHVLDQEELRIVDDRFVFPRLPPEQTDTLLAMIERLRERLQ